MMKVRMIRTHNPQDYFEGIEDPDLSECTIEDLDLPEIISLPLDGGYCVILRKISGHISVSCRRPGMNPLHIIRYRIRWMIRRLRWRLKGYGKN